MKQTIRLNENELRNLIAECVMQTLNEEVDERNIFTNMRDSMGAIRDTFTKGGNYMAHKNYRNMQTSRNDINKLNQRYGVQNSAMNTKQMANSMSEADVQQLEAEKQQAMAKITAKYDAKIEAARAKGTKQAEQYRKKKKAYNTQRDASRSQMRQAMGTNPYDNYKE